MNNFLKNKKMQQPSNNGRFKREEIERKVQEGAKKALKEYKKTFQILAESDRQ